MKGDRALPPLKGKARPKRRVKSPGFDVRTALHYVVGLDLTEIEGISELTALTLISEIGPGVSQFATVKKFCSWLELCPNWKKTGGRVKSSRTRRGVNRAAQALRLAAQNFRVGLSRRWSKPVIEVQVCRPYCGRGRIPNLARLCVTPRRSVYNGRHPLRMKQKPSVYRERKPNASAQPT